jgi:hypothetical protein
LSIAASTMMVKASPVSPYPATVSSPKIVENHSGSSDMIQSTDANVTVMTRKSSPGALTVRNRIESILLTALPLSCSPDHLLSDHIRAIQNTK